MNECRGLEMLIIRYSFVSRSRSRSLERILLGREVVELGRYEAVMGMIVLSLIA